MGADLAWTPVLRGDQSSPADTSITGFDLESGGVPGRQRSDFWSPASRGDVFRWTVRHRLTLSASIRSLRGVEGVLYADGQSVTASTASQTVASHSLLTVTFDQSIYSGAFAAEAEGEG